MTSPVTPPATPLPAGSSEDCATTHVLGQLPAVIYRKLKEQIEVCDLRVVYLDAVPADRVALVRAVLPLVGVQESDAPIADGDKVIAITAFSTREYAVAVFTAIVTGSAVPGPSLFGKLTDEQLLCVGQAVHMQVRPLPTEPTLYHDSVARIAQKYPSVYHALEKSGRTLAFALATATSRQPRRCDDMDQ